MDSGEKIKTRENSVKEMVQAGNQLKAGMRLNPTD